MNHVPEWLKRAFALQAVEDVAFVQLNADAYRYRDGIQFWNGKQVLLQDIRERVHFKVLSLGPEPEARRVPDPVLDCLIG
jgi:hypothetical protein